METTSGMGGAMREVCGVPWCDQSAHPDCFGVCEAHCREELALSHLEEEYANCWTDDDLERTKPLVVRPLEVRWEVHGGSPYGRAVLARACTSVAQAPEGTRNNTLNQEAHLVGGYIASGQVEAGHAGGMLLQAALMADMDAREACDVIERALRDGARKPIRPPERAA